ncbi:hypothetical protein BD414DRAFT_510131 [Trametes punicea]|nr:hypothetical protein BD414DRAFT_510131 [Trametes punicea]
MAQPWFSWLPCRPRSSTSNSGSSSSSSSSTSPKHDHRPHRYPRPLAHHLAISLTTSAVLLAAFLLFLLVGLSLPIIRSIYLFSIQFATNPAQPPTSIATALRLGPPAPAPDECFGPMLGYTIPQQILDLTGFPALVQDLNAGLTTVLVLHLVAAALAFLGVFSSLFLESHALAILSLLATIFALLVGLVVFAVDLALILLAKDRIGPLTEFNYVANWGPALWMVLAAVLLSFVGMVLMSVVVCECCGVGRKHPRRHHPTQDEKC